MQERKSMQLLKTYNGYSVTYYSNRQENPFVIKDHGKVVEKYADFHSCLVYISNVIPNFERMTL